MYFPPFPFYRNLPGLLSSRAVRQIAVVCVYSYKNRSQYGWGSESPMRNISSKPLRVDCSILALQTLSEHNLLFLPQEKEIIVVERTGGSYQAPRTGIESSPRSRRRRQPRTPRGGLILWERARKATFPFGIMDGWMFGLTRNVTTLMTKINKIKCGCPCNCTV